MRTMVAGCGRSEAEHEARMLEGELDKERRRNKKLQRRLHVADKRAVGALAELDVYVTHQSSHSVAWFDNSGALAG